MHDIAMPNDFVESLPDQVLSASFSVKVVDLVARNLTPAITPKRHIAATFIGSEMMKIRVSVAT